MEAVQEKIEEKILFRWFRKLFERKESRTANIIAPSGGTGVIWSARGYDNFARETYLKNVTAFRAIDEVAKSVASVPWKQFRKLSDGSREEITGAEGMTKVLNRPNPNESWPWVMLKTTAYLVMAGNAFIERIGPSSGPNKGNVQEMYSHRPDRFKILTTSGRITGYEYEVGGRRTNWQVDQLTGQADVLQLKAFHPLDDWWGAAPTESAAREIDTSNASVEWNKSLLDNQGRPGMVYTLIGALGAGQFDQLERYLREQHSGPTNVGKDLILTGERGTGASPYGWSPTDMDFGEGDLRLMRKISMAYGVPPMLLGIPGEATFANYREARLAFWETTIFWWLGYLRGELNNWLYREGDDRFVDYILDDVPALSVKRDQLWERAKNADFLTINQKLEMVGFPSYGPEGDVILVEASKIPLGTGKESETEEEEETEEETRKRLEGQGYSKDEIDDMMIGDYEENDADNIEADLDFDPAEGKPYPNEYACRLNPLGKYDKFARMNCFKRSAGKCIDYIFGIKEGKIEVQALRYKKDVWSEKDARFHCSGRGGEFE